MPAFKIAAAQVRSVRGDLDGNIATHAAAMTAAAKHGVSVLVFPELSLSGYEPDLAEELAITALDRRLAPLLDLAREHQIEAVVGAPLRNGEAKPALGAIWITASGPTRIYRKMHLGAGERDYFTPGDTPLAVAIAGHTVGIAICAGFVATGASPIVCRSRCGHLRRGRLYECRMVRDGYAQARGLCGAPPDADRDGQPRGLGRHLYLRG